MRINIGQILVLLIIGFLLFGDVENFKKKLKTFSKKTKIFLQEKTRKKRI